MSKPIPENELEPHSFEKFGIGSRRILLQAEKQAKARKQPVDTGHVLFAVLEAKGTLAADMLEGFGLSLNRLGALLGIGESAVSTAPGLAEELKLALERAFSEASRYHHFTIDPEHILLGSLSDKQFRAVQMLEILDVPWQRVRDQICELFQAYQAMDDQADEEQPPELTMPTIQEAPREERKSAIEQFTTDLTAEALAGKLDPLIGREPELNRLVHILSRRTKNNPVLLGDPGIGKTAIVEGLAQRLAKCEISGPLKQYRLLQLDLGQLVAGTMYRGQFEERLKRLLSEFREEKNIIIFVDEMHSLVGAGGAEGAMDAAQMLKPVLARGSLRLVGATTAAEYQRIISKDKALERRFQTVRLQPPSKEQTLAILRGLKKHYANYHQVTISDEALKSAVALSDRYISERFFPDKAIDLIDEAAAHVRNSSLKLSEADQVDRKLARIRRLKSQAVRLEQFRAAEDMRREERELEELLLEAKRGEHGKLAVVGPEAIAKVVGVWTGIPVETLLEEEHDRIMKLEKRLRARIIGQDEAISSVVRSIRRYRSGVADSHRPIGAFLLIGPTGVGKTELARAVAEEAFGHPDALIKLDLSEFMERHQTARLLGAPPGYVGYDEGSSLGEQLRRRPHSVVLFDEIEKASYDFPNLLLQIMEDGQLTDAQGTVINFRHSLILMTSNLGMADAVRPPTELGFSAGNDDDSAGVATKRMTNLIMSALKDYFAPEFLSRLSETLIFQPLGEKEMRLIAQTELRKLKLRLRAHRRQLTIDSSVPVEIATLALQGTEGARLIRRIVESEVEPVVADLIIQTPTAKKIHVGYDVKEHLFTASV